MPADAVIMAFGFHPHGMSWLESHGVKVDNWGRIAASVESEFRYQTSNRKFSPAEMRCAAPIWW